MRFLVESFALLGFEIMSEKINYSFEYDECLYSIFLPVSFSTKNRRHDLITPHNVNITT